MTRKAVATFGTGPAQEQLAISLDSFRAYARAHDYELVVGDGSSDGRPPPWGKVPLLRELVQKFDAVLWLDADTLVLDPRIDINAVVPRSCFQAMTNSVLNASESAPCSGVWFLRAGDRTDAFLDAVWAATQFIDHQWWEQAAVMHLLGWSTEHPLRSVDAAAPWRTGTHWLPETWDMLITFQIGFARGFIRHYAGIPYADRISLMRADWRVVQARPVTRPVAMVRALAAQAAWRWRWGRANDALRREMYLVLPPHLRSGIRRARRLLRTSSS